MKTYEECQADPVYCVIKQSTIESINNYVLYGYEPGGFVNAVLANDLMQAMGGADRENRLTLHAICSYIYNEISMSCHGSYEKVEAHLKYVHERLSRD